MVTCKDDASYFSFQMATLLGRESEEHLPVKMFTDSIPLLESIGSTKQVEEKMLRNSIADFKEAIEQGLVISYSWLDTKEMLADILTKECRRNKLVVEVLMQNCFRNASAKKNQVILGDGELKLINRATKENKKEEVET